MSLLSLQPNFAKRKRRGKKEEEEELALRRNCSFLYVIPNFDSAQHKKDELFYRTQMDIKLCHLTSNSSVHRHIFCQFWG